MELKEVWLADIVVDPKYQVRIKLNSDTIDRYSKVYEHGGKLPPITLARIDGVLFLVDGWHRVEAIKLLGIKKTEAEIHDVSINEARWMAALANTKNGLPLKDKEIRKVFNVFVATKKHIKPSGELMSYREMAEEFKLKGHTTIRRWIEKDHPKLFDKMSGKDGYAGNPEPYTIKKADPESEFIEVARDGINNLVNAYRGIKDADRRGEVIELLEQTLATLRSGGEFRRSEF